MMMEQPTSGDARTIRTVKLWIKAFIPNTYAHAITVPGEGAHSSKAMLNGPWMVNLCVLTDQRGVSSEMHGDGRMRSEIEVDLAKGKEISQFHHCYVTGEVLCNPGIERCRARGP